MIGRRTLLGAVAALAAPGVARAQAAPRWTLRHGEAIRQLQFDAAGRRLIVIGRRRLSIWRTDDGTRIEQRDLPRGASLLRGDGARLLITHETGTQIFDPFTGVEIRGVPGMLQVNLEHVVDPTSINLAPFGRHIATTDRENVIRVIDTTDGRVRAAIAPDVIGIIADKRLRSAEATADGRFVAGVLAVEAEAAEIFIFDVAAGRVVHRAPHPAGVHGYVITLAPGGGHAVACGAFAENFMIALPGGTPLTDFTVGESGEAVRPRVIFSADGRALVASRDGGILRLWRADAPTQSRAIEAHPTWIDVTDFAPDGRRFATLSHHGDVAVWSALDGGLVVRFPGRETQASALAFGPNGLLASGHVPGIARVWAVPRG